MPKFYQSKEVSVEFRVVRAFITPQQVQKEHGIYANFSAKTFVKTSDGREIPLMSHNSLTISISAEGHPFVGSKYEDVPSTNQRVYFTALFPGVMIPGASEELKNLSDRFINELIGEIQEFVKMARKRQENSERERFANVPPALRNLSKLAPVKEAQPEKKKEAQDLPL